VEVLTQRLPNWENREPVPNNVPEPFREIARHCLRQNPQDRWSVNEISARLDQPAPRKTQSAPSHKKNGIKGSTIAIVAGVVVVALLVGSQLRSSRNQEAPTPEVTATADSEQPVKPAPKPVAVPSAVPSKIKAAAVKPAGVKAAEVKPAAIKPAAAQPHIAGASAKGAVLEQVMPKVAASARRTVSGRLKVVAKVAVDATGNVTSASLDSPGPSQYFARLALEAARGWKFTPPQVNGQAVPSAWKLRFTYTSRETEVAPQQTAP
jgi:TonB family protein